MSDEEGRIPTSERLAQALELANAPQEMIARARAGYYDDYKSEVPAPIMQLVQDARAAGLTDIAMRAIDGQFDASRWEAEEWGKSPEAQELFSHFITRGGGIPRGPRGPYKPGRTGERPRKREQARQKKQQKGTQR